MLPYPLTTTLSDINDDVVINTIRFMALYKFLENKFVRIEMKSWCELFETFIYNWQQRGFYLARYYFYIISYSRMSFSHPYRQNHFLSALHTIHWDTLEVSMMMRLVRKSFKMDAIKWDLHSIFHCTFQKTTHSNKNPVTKKSDLFSYNLLHIATK